MQASPMANKPKILFALTEDRNRVATAVNGISVQYQLSLLEMGGERRVSLVFNASFPEIELDGEWELILNYSATELLASKLNVFLEANKPPQETET
jgi:hypothetical protein